MKKNKIEIKIKKIENNNAKNFIQTEIAHCKQHKIRINVINDPNLVECNGHFTDGEPPCLSAYINENIEDWLPIFVHETCHKDQYLETTDIWNKRIGNEYDALEIFDMWIDHHIELLPHQLRSVLENIVQVELDCERRSVIKIQKYDLPIDISEYIQKANSYIWYHHAASHVRAYTQRSSPYVNPDIWAKMPVDFNRNYSTIKNKMLKLYLKHCY